MTRAIDMASANWTGMTSTTSATVVNSALRKLASPSMRSTFAKLNPPSAPSKARAKAWTIGAAKKMARNAIDGRRRA
jgi:hypothetical protein